MTVKSAATLIQPNRDDRLRQALQARYERADRITSTRADLRVKILQPSEVPGGMVTVPGWTDGNVIYINDAVLQVSQMDDKALVAALGVNLHELAHVIETPNLKGMLAKRVRSQGQSAWHSFNILEDQRAESFFVARFSDAPKFYTPMVLRWLMNKEATSGNFALLYGRRYLPRDLINYMRDQFAVPELVSDFEDIIDTYRALDVHRNEKVAFQLIKDFTDLLQQVRDKVSDTDLRLSSGHSDNPSEAVANEQRPVNETPDADESRELSDAVEEQQNPESINDSLDTEEDGGDEVEEDAPEEDADQPEEVGDDEGGDSAEGEAEESSDPDAEGSTASDDVEGDASDGEAEGSDGESGNPPEGEGSESSEEGESGSGGNDAGTGEGEAPTTPPSIDDLDEYLREALETVLGDEDVADELAETRDDVQQSSRGIQKPQSPEFDENSMYHSPLTLEKMGYVKATAKRLQDARVGAETVLKRQVRSGMLNPLALQKAQPGDLDVFDTWDAGLVGEEGEMDVAILCDVSGSMRDSINDAAFTLYAIKRAFESLGDTHVTVWTFASGSHLLYDRDERVSNSYYKVPHAYGGTNPRTAIEDAFRILGTTKSRLRLLIIITDGAWSRADLGDALVAQANAAGVVTVLVGLDRAFDIYGRHNCQIARDLNEPKDLPEVAGDVAAAMVNAAEKNTRR